MTTVPGTPQAPAPTAAPPAPAGSMMAITADPAPLGLVAFGLTTLVLSVVNSGWVGNDSSGVNPATLGVLSLALPFGGIGQALAGMWAFRRNNTFAATAFTSYGAFWVSYWLLVVFYVTPLGAAAGVGTLHSFLGLYLFAWGLFTAYMFVASLASPRAVQTVFLLLAITFFLLAIGEWNAPATGVSTWHHIGGYVGIATAVAAMYTSFADVTNAQFKRTVLPTF